MNKSELFKKYGGFFLLAVAIIVFYKLFDSLSIFVSIFSRLLSILTPVVIGAVLAYFLSPIASLVEKKLATVNKVQNHKRLISVLLVFLGFILSIVIIIMVITPTLTKTVVDLASSMDTYVVNFRSTASEIIQNKEVLNFVMNIENGVVKFIETLAMLDPMLYIQSIFSAASTMLTVILGLVFCPYILIERDSLGKLFNKIMLLFISKEKLDFIHNYMYKSHQIFGQFVYGKFIDSLIIGLIALVGFALMGLDAFVLLAFIILVTNMIPYFGPFIGGIPVVFFTLLTGGFVPAIWTTIFIFILQQFDGLILGPAILGESVGISPFWIIFAITVFGGLFGFIGMFLGVPLICVLRMFFNDYLQYKKNSKEKQQIE